MMTDFTFHVDSVILIHDNVRMSRYKPMTLIDDNIRMCTRRYKPGNEHLLLTTATAPAPTPIHKTNIARLVGEVVGTIVALLVIIAIAICVYRRCKRKPKFLDDQQQAPTVKSMLTFIFNNIQ